MDTPAPNTDALPRFDSFRGGGDARNVQIGAGGNATLEGRHVLVGTGRQRGELVDESTDTTEEHQSVPQTGPQEVQIFQLAPQDSSSSDGQKLPEEVWAAHLLPLEQQVAQFSGSEEKRQFLNEQMAILKEKIRLMCPEEDSDGGRQWVCHLVSVFEQLMLHLNSGAIPEMKAEFIAPCREEDSIINYEYLKFENLTSWVPLGRDLERPCDNSLDDGDYFNFERNGFSRENLQKYVSELRVNLDNGRSAHSYAVDRLLMDDLVAFENKMNPGINLHHIHDAYQFNKALKHLLEANESTECSLRFMVCAGDTPAEVDSVQDVRFFVKERLIHYCAVDVKRINGKISVLVMEPVLLENDTFKILKRKIMPEFSSEFPGASIQFFGLDVQRSDGECHIFCFSFLRKACSLKTEFDLLHKKNLEGELGSMSSNALSNSLPVKLMKHAQSRWRIEEYLGFNESLGVLGVNKKNETLVERFEGHRANLEFSGRDRIRGSTSIHEKRLSIVSKFAESIDSNSNRTKKDEEFDKID